MAGFSAAAAASGIVAYDRHLLEEVVVTMEKGESVEITALSEELSQEAAAILQERHMLSRPMKAFGRSCSQQLNFNEDNPGPNDAKPRKKKEVDTMNPMLRMALNVMPITTWLPQLRLPTIKADMIAGLTVGVMVIPQSMSYGNIAGLPYIYGMYSACVPTFVYALFGQSRQLAVGPVAMVSLLVEAGLRGQLTEGECPEWYEMGGESSGRAQYDVCPDAYVGLATLTAMMVGVMQIVASILKLGFLVSFLGHPVTSGFTSGAAIIIGLSQLKYILGYDIKKSQYIYETVGYIFADLGKTKGMPLLLGVMFFGYLIMNKHVARTHKKFKILGPLGPLLCCSVGTLLLLALPTLHEDFYVKYVGSIPDGLMPISIGSWSLSMVPRVLPTALSSCLIGYMESIAIGKNLASKHGYEIEAGQEMLALGISNLVGSIFSCYPVTGSFSRSAVNNDTGALSQFSGFVTAVVMFATLLFLTPLFYYLPKFALAAIVMSSVVPLVAFSEAKKLLRVKRHDFVLWVVAFVGTLFLGVLMGIAVAVGLSLVIVIYESVRPQLTILWRIPGTTIYRNMKQESSGTFIPNVFICRIGSSLYFANASFVKDMLLAYVNDLEEVNTTEYMILEMTPVVSIDSTAVHIIQDIVQDFRSRGIQTAFAMVGNRVDKTMRKAGLKSFIGEQWFFPTVNEAVQYCVRHQHVKKARLEDETERNRSTGALDVAMINVAMSDEIGFSNDLHNACTMVFITLAKDIPMIMSEITATFKRNSISIVRAQIEPLTADGAKHTYFLKSIKTGGKLLEWECERLREELHTTLANHGMRNPSKAETHGDITREHTMNGSMSMNGMLTTDQDDTRIAKLEQALQEQRKQLHAQKTQLDSLSTFGRVRNKFCCLFP